MNYPKLLNYILIGVCFVMLAANVGMLFTRHINAWQFYIFLTLFLIVIVLINILNQLERKYK